MTYLFFHLYLLQVVIIIILLHFSLFFSDPVISTKHCTKDLFSFCEEIRKVRASNKFLISYVCSLFTSIPLTETIDTAVDLLFEMNPSFEICKAHLKTLFQFATSAKHFMFEGNFYDQIVWQWVHHWALFQRIFYGIL